MLHGVSFLLPPANEVLHLSVSHYVHSGGGGVCLSACWDTHSPQEQTSPRGADTPLEQISLGGRHSPEQTSPRADTHPQEQTPPPRADTHPQEQTHPEADTHPREQTPPCAVHAGRYGQEVGGTHPTGMHTC